jgi:hypothetical protein
MSWNEEKAQEEYLKKLVSVNKLIAEDLIKNPSFKIEDLERVKARMDTLIPQLEFWIKQDNKERFIYELKDYINWVLEQYS